MAARTVHITYKTRCFEWPTQSCSKLFLVYPTLQGCRLRFAYILLFLFVSWRHASSVRLQVSLRCISSCESVRGRTRRLSAVLSGRKTQDEDTRCRLHGGSDGSACFGAIGIVAEQVTIGIFNLIMAVFIDNVTDGSTKKRQRQLGQNQPKTEWAPCQQGFSRICLFGCLLPCLLPCFLASLFPCFLVSLFPCFLASLLPCFLASWFPLLRLLRLLACFLVSLFPCFLVSSIPGFLASLAPCFACFLACLLASLCRLLPCFVCFLASLACLLCSLARLLAWPSCMPACLPARRSVGRFVCWSVCLFALLAVCAHAYAQLSGHCQHLETHHPHKHRPQGGTCTPMMPCSFGLKFCHRTLRRVKLPNWMATSSWS